MSRVTKFLLAIFVVFLACQIVRPARTNPAVERSNALEAHVDVPADVDAILTRACFNCHSNTTRWPWYSNVAPVSWLVAHDVNTGRFHLNFSDWEARHHHEDESPFDQMCKLTREGDMPPWYYRVMHPEARVTPADVESICAWTARQPKDR